MPLDKGHFIIKVMILPISMLVVEPKISRFLDALEKRHAESVRRHADAISFGSFRKEVAQDV